MKMTLEKRFEKLCIVTKRNPNIRNLVIRLVGLQKKTQRTEKKISDTDEARTKAAVGGWRKNTRRKQLKTDEAW